MTVISQLTSVESDGTSYTDQQTTISDSRFQMKSNYNVNWLATLWPSWRFWWRRRKIYTISSVKDERQWFFTLDFAHHPLSLYSQHTSENIRVADRSDARDSPEWCNRTHIEAVRVAGVSQETHMRRSNSTTPTQFFLDIISSSRGVDFPLL